MSSPSLSPTTVVSLRNELAHAALDAMWAQWRAIGGSASNAKPASAIVDPEALILASLRAQDEEPRLRDILYAWVKRSGALISVHRLRKLAPLDQPAVVERLREFSAHAVKLAKHPRWATLTGGNADAHAPTETFAVARAVEPMLDVPPALMLRMRAALGVSAKADVLT